MSFPIPVLLYHSVAEDPGRFTVTPAAFAAHAAAVRASGRTALCVSELAAALRGERPLPHRPVAITFDDGYADTYDAVAALSDVGLAATVYMTAGEVGGSDRLSPARLAELARAEGVEVGAHAVEHRRLDELGERELLFEVRASKAMLEDLTQVEVRSFAYPHGAHDRRARHAVIEAGYGSAAAVKNAVSHPGDDVFAIARWTVTAGTSPARIAQVLEGVRVPLAWVGERPRTRVYRVARRERRRMASAFARGR
jgi:peptidoglycan/xylan/chitin deacetylase (PgdA/CDA1 family)